MGGNRKSRRKGWSNTGAGKYGSGENPAPGVIVLHYRPSEFDKVYTAILMAQLAHAVDLGSKLPGTQWPIHIEVRFGGKRVCGAVGGPVTEKSPTSSNRGDL